MKINKIKILFILFLAILAIPILLNYFMPLVKGRTGNEESWLSFWGSWLGAILGSIATIVGVRWTLNDNNDKFSKNFRYQRLLYEDDRELNLMPYIKLEILEKTQIASGDNWVEFYNGYYDQDYELLNINLKNIGLGSAINIKIVFDRKIGLIRGIDDVEYSYDLGINESIRISLMLNMHNHDKCQISFIYNDIIGKTTYIRSGCVYKVSKSTYDIKLDSLKKKVKFKGSR